MEEPIDPAVMSDKIEFDQPMLICDEAGNIVAELENAWAQETRHNIIDPIISQSTNENQGPAFGQEGFWVNLPNEPVNEGEEDGDKEKTDEEAKESIRMKNMPRIRAALSREVGPKTTKSIFAALKQAADPVRASFVRSSIWKKYNAIKRVKVVEQKERSLKEEKARLLEIIWAPLITPVSSASQENPNVEVSAEPGQEPEKKPEKKKVGRPRKERDPNAIKRGRGRPKSDKPPKSPKQRGRPSYATLKERELLKQLPTVSSGAHDELIILNPVDPAIQRSDNSIPFTIELPTINKSQSNGWSKTDAGSLKQKLNIETETVEQIKKRKPAKTNKQQHMKKPHNQVNDEIEIAVFGEVISETEEEEG